MLNKVLLSTDVTLACVQHALSTEKEEIMGLLIGEVSFMHRQLRKLKNKKLIFSLNNRFMKTIRWCL